MSTFSQRMVSATGSKLTGLTHSTLQVNVGNRCNHLCTHCHVQATPESTDIMNWDLMKYVLKVADEIHPELVDITGGAPELNPSLPRFLEALVDRNHNVQVRTNLTVLLDPELRGHMKMYRDLRVRLVGSLPCYLEEDVDRQRGKGVFKRSIQILRELNAVGYGINPKLELNLVFNPEDAFLPPDQSKLEKTYKETLSSEFDIQFNRLLTITNMPIGRFRQMLEAGQKSAQYQQLLEESFNPLTLDKLMCRHQVCVGWDGLLYDCDFNFALELPVVTTPRQVNLFDRASHRTREIVTGSHCFGCTAGFGSSCAGALE
ncbi:MAG: arsenosugar biosynthesis radical SAM protein ArsS [Candidatus Thorarchaeota archaeon]|nr:MAG: arsenosugar biosynthesis radical SAM protein ArsS [Candidatus Thorarchaeota archaeon]